MKTAADLGMTETELSSLKIVRDLLASGLISHHDMEWDADARSNFFNMGSAHCSISSHDCGSVMCIGGWVKAVDEKLVDPLNPSKSAITSDAKIDLIDYVSRSEVNEPLFELYHPSFQDWDSITPAMAVDAIENFLTHGEPSWLSVAAKHLGSSAH